MITQRDFNDATRRKFNDMQKRLKPRFYRTGKRAGQQRTAGCTLPFSLAEFRTWAMAHIGFQAVKCFYCPRMIDILNCELDHHIPLSCAPSMPLAKILALDNLRASCEECNRIKGEILPEDYPEFIACVERLSFLSRHDILKRMKAGAMGIRLGYHMHTPAENAAKRPQLVQPIAKTRSLDFEDF